MRLHKEYDWLNSYISSPQFWVEDVLNWDESFNLALSDYSLFTLLLSPFMTKTYIYLESFTKMSFLDILVISESSNVFEIQEFYNAVMWDLFEMIQILFYPFQFIFYTNYQDFCLIVLHHSPELVLALTDFITVYCNSNVLSFTVAAVSTVFNDSIVLGVLKLINFITLLCVYVWFTFIFFYIFRLTKWDNALETYFTRLSLYFYSASKENRLQFEAILLTVMLFTFLFTWNIVTFKDMYEESMESLTLLLFYIFLFVYVFFLYKNSIHYFSFLEASVTNRRVASLFVQFGKDAANSFVLLLRFLALLVRLNIYDTVDDVLDSNYIFNCDFQDESYTTDLFGRFYNAMFTNGDYSVSETIFTTYSTNYYFDLFSLYFIVCFKFLSFIFFALEAIGRVLLAFFILYLVIFEMQSVNRSYTEDLFINNARKNN